jgi:YHS domain-containing protein
MQKYEANAMTDFFSGTSVPTSNIEKMLSEHQKQYYFAAERNGLVDHARMVARGLGQKVSRGTYRFTDPVCGMVITAEHVATGIDQLTVEMGERYVLSTPGQFCVTDDRVWVDRIEALYPGAAVINVA